MASGQPEEVDTVGVHDDGTFHYAHVRTFPAFDSLGNVTGFVEVVEDTSARRQATEALRESESRYRRLYETIMDAVAIVDMAGYIKESNPAFRALVGYPEEELLRLTYEDLTPEKWHPLEANIIAEQVMVQGYSHVYEKEYRRKDGGIIPIELRAFLVRDDARQPIGILAIVRDISQRQEMLEALEKSEQRFRDITENAVEWVWEVDVEGEVYLFQSSGGAIIGLQA